LKVLALNYPDHPYVTGETEKTFWNRLWPFGKD